MQPNIILICLDTVRKDIFEEEAARLTDISDINADQARAASSCTVPSHASLISGQLPEVHGVYTYDPDISQIEKKDTVFSSLSEYRKIGVSANPYAGTASNFDYFFDDFTDVSPQRRLPDGLDVGVFALNNETTGYRRYIQFLQEVVEHENSMASIINGAFAFLNRISMDSDIIPKIIDYGAKYVLDTAERKICSLSNDEPIFMYLNLMEAHEPMADVLAYDSDSSVPSAWNSDCLEFDAINIGKAEASIEDLQIYRELYRSSIRYMDKKIQSFIQSVESSIQDETTFIIFSDHGERLGFDKNDLELGHNMSRLTESLLHVPLLIKNPPQNFDLDPDSRFSLLNCKELIDSIIQNKPLETATDLVVAERLASTIVRKFDLDEDEVQKWNETRRCFYDKEQKFVWTGLGRSFEYAIQDYCAQDIIATDIKLPDAAHSPFQTTIESANRRYDIQLDKTMDEKTKQQLTDLGYL